MTTLEGNKSVKGNERQSQMLQSPIFHYIMKEFVESKNLNPSGQALKIMHEVVRSVHGSMRSPYGKMEMAVRNLDKNYEQNRYYAIKDLESLPQIMENEEYFKRSLALNITFRENWQEVKTEIEKLLCEIKGHAVNNNSSISLLSIRRFVKREGDEHFKKSSRKCFTILKQAWQKIWHEYQEICDNMRELGKITNS